MPLVDTNNLVIMPTPSGLEVDYDKNLTPLYEAICNCEWEAAIDAVIADPQQAETWVVRHYDEEDDNGEREVMWRFLPIHSACARQPPASLISALIKAYPDGAKCIDDQGMYALHYACGNQASREVIRLLLVANSQAAKMTDPRGMLPIHYLACWGPSSVSIIDMVLVAYRDVADIKDDDGNTALDLALEGEYADRDAVVGALRRWLENATPKAAEEEFAPRDQPPPLVVDTKPFSPVENKSKALPSTNDKGPTFEVRAAPKTTPAVDSPRTVGRLRHEVAKLKSELKAKEAEMDEERSVQTSSYQQELASLMAEHESKTKQILEHKETLAEELARKKLEHQAELEETQSAYQNECASLKTQLKETTLDFEDQLAAVKAELKQTKLDLEEKEMALVKEEEATATAQGLLEACEQERDELRNTLADLSRDYDKQKKKADNMGNRLGSLTASLETLSEEQTHLMGKLKVASSQWKESAEDRRTKLQLLLDAENEMIEKSSSLVDSDDFSRQIKEMDAISAVIAALR